MIHNPDKHVAIPLGVVVRRVPGATKWATWSWKAVALLPGAGPADWRVLREEGQVTEYHAATLTLELHAAETEAYLHGLSAQVPAVFVVMRAAAASADKPLDVTLVTASPYEAQDYADNGEDIVEKVPMPAGLIAWVQEFVEAHHREETFKKRRRDKIDLGQVQDGVGDPRIVQMTGVYRSPQLARKGRLQ